MSIHLLNFIKHRFFVIVSFFLFVLSVSLSGYIYIAGSNIKKLSASNSSLTKSVENFQNEDQYKRNEKLQVEVKNIKTSYAKSLSFYEDILDLRAQKVDVTQLEELYAKIAKELSEFNYSSASSNLVVLEKEIQKKTPSSTISTANAPVKNTPPGSGYSVQQVKTDAGTFKVVIIAGDLNSTRVIIDTASDGTCANECPVLPLATYVSRSNAYAGINGSFFCPAEYPSCVGKTNSFDTLVMNKNKVYFNSDNNIYSTVPAVVFGGNWARFVSRSLDWGRDTSVDAVIGNYPLYVQGGQNIFGGSGDAKLTSQGARTFIANKGNMVYIGIVYGASSSDAAKVFHALGMENALGLDQGGSTALWHSGYKAGPGRNIPSAILFVGK